MEKVKYRAWDGERMEYFDDLYWFEEEMAHRVINGQIEAHGRTKTIMQYSCLNDMNGEEIYEDDIFLIDHGGGHTWTERVIFHLGCFMAGEDNILGSEAIHLSGRVIGNIHQNPELDPKKQDLNPHHRRV